MITPEQAFGRTIRATFETGAVITGPTIIGFEFVGIRYSDTRRGWIQPVITHNKPVATIVKLELVDEPTGEETQPIEPIIPFADSDVDLIQNLDDIQPGDTVTTFDGNRYTVVKVGKRHNKFIVTCDSVDSTFTIDREAIDSATRRNNR